jgi:hypothetical protein
MKTATVIYTDGRTLPDPAAERGARSARQLVGPNSGPVARGRLRPRLGPPGHGGVGALQVPAANRSG